MSLFHTVFFFGHYCTAIYCMYASTLLHFIISISVSDEDEFIIIAQHTFRSFSAPADSAKKIATVTNKMIKHQLLVRLRCDDGATLRMQRKYIFLTCRRRLLLESC